MVLIGRGCAEIIVTQNRAALIILLVMIKKKKKKNHGYISSRRHQYTVRQEVRTNERYISFTKSKKENGKIERSDWLTGSRPSLQLSYLLRLI